MGSVSVLGLGGMGSAMARAFLKGGHRVTVWNRSPERASRLVSEGAILADSPAAAIAASPLSIMCVIDCHVAAELLADDGVAAAIAERTLVQFSTGSREQIAEQHGLIRDCGGQFIVGSIPGPPSAVGQDEALLIYAGDPAFHDHCEALEALGKAPQYLGGDPNTAVVVNCALVGYHIPAMGGFFEGAAAARDCGIDIKSYWSMLHRSFGALTHILGVFVERIAAQDYDAQRPDYAGATIDNMRLGLLDAAQTFRELGLAPGVTDAMYRYAQRAADLGHGSKDMAYLIECAKTDAN